MNNRPIPQEFWRGLSNKDFICQGYVVAGAFQFDKEIREDGYKELSINWNDDEGALKTALTQRKENGKIQFKAGAANLSVAKMKMCLQQFIDNKQFDYERRVVDGNDYHGNLLLQASLTKQVATMVANGLCLSVEKIVENPNED